ncbi:MAG: DUF1292 domain-containing protein [Faecalibacterium sp.]|nr:DUF1292 domain-containing protein [Faecalibacterium sp.]
MEEKKENGAAPAQEPEEEQTDFITLSDDAGNEVTFEKIDELDHDGTHYIAVVEAADAEKPAEDEDVMVILSVGKDDDGEFFEIVDDDEQLLTLGKLFEKHLGDAYEITQ